MKRFHFVPLAFYIVIVLRIAAADAGSTASNLTPTEQQLQSQLALLTTAGGNLPTGNYTVNSNFTATPESMALGLTVLQRLSTDAAKNLSDHIQGDSVIFVNAAPTVTGAASYYYTLNVVKQLNKRNADLLTLDMKKYVGQLGNLKDDFTEKDIPTLVMPKIPLGALPLLISAIPPAVSGITGLFRTDTTISAGSLNIPGSTLIAMVAAQLRAQLKLSTPPKNIHIFTSLDGWITTTLKGGGIADSDIGSSLLALQNTQAEINGLNDTLTQLVKRWSDAYAGEKDPGKPDRDNKLLLLLKDLAARYSAAAAADKAILDAFDVSTKSDAIIALMNEEVVLKHGDQATFVSLAFSSQGAAVTQLKHWWGNQSYVSAVFGIEASIITPTGEIVWNSVIAGRHAEKTPNWIRPFSLPKSDLKGETATLPFIAYKTK